MPSSISSDPTVVFGDISLPIPLVPVVPAFSPSYEGGSMSSGDYHQLCSFSGYSVRDGFVTVLVSTTIVLIDFLWLLFAGYRGTVSVVVLPLRSYGGLFFSVIFA